MRLFGTDGVRAPYGSNFMNVRFAQDLLSAAYEPLRLWEAPLLLGRDTRESGEALRSAVLSRAGELGLGVSDLGVVPSGVLAFFAKQRGAYALMISASHNPYGDNGLKFFSPLGQKLAPGLERAIEAQFSAASDGSPVFSGELSVRPSGLKAEPSSLSEYEARIRALLGEGGALSGLKVVLDCANGASSAWAPKLFETFGAEVITLSASPNGRNINEHCGSTHPESVMAAVVSHGADVGWAFDGDADRLVGVTPGGVLLDGDDLLYWYAELLVDRGQIPAAVVGTSMTNGGLQAALSARGVSLFRTDVGDRHVLEKLLSEDLPLGGESSGHVIPRFLDQLTGDGLLSALVLSKDALQRKQSGRSIPVFAHFPQEILNFPLQPSQESVLPSLSAVESKLQASGGRMIVRKSGTEPLLRVMIEGPLESFGRAKSEVLRLLGGGDAV